MELQPTETNLGAQIPKQSWFSEEFAYRALKHDSESMKQLKQTKSLPQKISPGFQLIYLKNR